MATILILNYQHDVEKIFVGNSHDEVLNKLVSYLHLHDKPNAGGRDMLERDLENYLAFHERNVVMEDTDHEDADSIRKVGIVEFDEYFAIFGAATHSEYENYLHEVLEEIFEDYDTNYSPSANLFQMETAMGMRVVEDYLVR